LGALAVDDGTEPAGRAADAAASAAAQFAALLAARGVAVGTVAAGPAPADAPDVATIESPPLDELVAAMLTSSDNYTA
ncbi:D-alanyl-D-alanine carboxypeptidase, partial [Escherichia coli]|nr:D-alanyl-D-alanine carboxypeptidase [Escherichia coli]